MSLHNAQVHWSAYYLIKTIIILNFQWGKRGLESWSDLPKITQSFPVKAQSQAVSWTLNHFYKLSPNELVPHKGCLLW